MQLIGDLWVGTIRANKVRQLDQVLIDRLTGTTFHISSPDIPSNAVLVDLRLNPFELDVD